MDDDALETLACALILKKKRGRRERRKHWTRSWIDNRHKLGAFNSLIPEILKDTASYRNFFRMSRRQFDEILGRVQLLIEKQDTQLRRAIPAAERLAVTLRFLATGNIFWLLRLIILSFLQKFFKLIYIMTFYIMSLKNRFSYLSKFDEVWVR